MKSTIHINQRLSLSERLIVVFLLVLSFENIIEYYSGSKIGIAVLIYRIIAAGYAVFCFFLCVRSKYKRNSYSTAELLLFIFIFMWSVLCLLFHGVEKDFFTGVIYCLYTGVKTLAFQAKPLGQPHISRFRKKKCRDTKLEVRKWKTIENQPIARMISNTILYG